MVKKISVTLVIALVTALLLQVTVMADVLEVDTASPMFKADTWQNNDANNEVCPLDKCFETTPTRGIDNADISRYSGIVQLNQANIEGEPVLIDGSTTNSVYFPFKETVNLESLTLKFNNGTRQYFFLVYTSMDGENWTEIDISENARRVDIDTTYDADGDLFGPAVKNVYASYAAGSTDDDDVFPITFKFAEAYKANYFKILFYGNDGGADVLEVTHAWTSFNSVKFEGTVFVEEAVAAGEEDAANTDAGDTVAADTSAAEVTVAPINASVEVPQTGDVNMTVLFIISAVCGAGIIVFRKKTFVK